MTANNEPARRAPTINDVARLAGVSHMTVSRVLNGAAAVRPATRARVEQASQALGYTPNALARGLARRITGVIGLVISDITNPFIADLARAVHRFADDASYVVNMVMTDYDPDRELRALEVLVERRVDGLIVGPPANRANGRLHQLVDQGLPIVAVARSVNHPRVPEVQPRVAESTRQIAEHLIELGHRRIAYIAGSPRVGLGRGKLDGYRTALRAAGLPIDESLVIGSDMSVRDAYGAAQVLLRRVPRPTAIMAATDTMAIGAMGAIEAAGLRIPADISVVGFDDIPFAATMHPQLTTAAQPVYELGRTAARLLFDRLQGEPVVEHDRVWLDCPLVIRGSTGRRRDSGSDVSVAAS